MTKLLPLPSLKMKNAAEGKQENNMSDIGKIMIYAGIALIAAGLLFHFGSKILPLGKLPFDFKWESGNFGVYFPMGSCIVISIILTIILNILFR